MPAPGRLLCCLLPLSALWCGWPAQVVAQEAVLNRCAGPGGNTIYTDRPCDSIGASERLPRGEIAGSHGLRRGGCARNLRDLVYEITAAIDNRDVNRLGAVYHWVGQGQESGYRVLDRLQAIVDRPLVDIVPLRAALAEAPAMPAAIAPPSIPLVPAPVAPPPASGATLSSPTATAADAAPAPVRRTPVGLRLEQTLGKGSTPSRTVLGLRRHFDCWWVTL